MASQEQKQSGRQGIKDYTRELNCLHGAQGVAVKASSVAQDGLTQGNGIGGGVKKANPPKGAGGE